LLFGPGTGAIGDNAIKALDDDQLFEDAGDGPGCGCGLEVELGGRRISDHPICQTDE
jgi:hypothetical protein